MFFTTIKNDYNKYNLSDSKFADAFEFLRTSNLMELALGKHVTEKGVVFNVMEYTTKAPSECRYESHDRFFDIQYVASGEESVWIENRSFLNVEIPYDQEKDITFYKDSETGSCITLKAGSYVLLPPEEAHKPMCISRKPEKVRKIVVKIPV